MPVEILCVGQIFMCRSKFYVPVKILCGGQNFMWRSKFYVPVKILCAGQNFMCRSKSRAKFCTKVPWAIKTASLEILIARFGLHEYCEME